MRLAAAILALLLTVPADAAVVRSALAGTTRTGLGRTFEAPPPAGGGPLVPARIRYGSSGSPTCPFGGSSGTYVDGTAAGPLTLPTSQTTSNIPGCALRVFVGFSVSNLAGLTVVGTYDHYASDGGWSGPPAGLFTTGGGSGSSLVFSSDTIYTLNTTYFWQGGGKVTWATPLTGFAPGWITGWGTKYAGDDDTFYWVSFVFVGDFLPTAPHGAYTITSITGIPY